MKKDTKKKTIRKKVTQKDEYDFLKAFVFMELAKQEENIKKTERKIGLLVNFFSVFIIVETFFLAIILILK